MRVVGAAISIVAILGMVVGHASATQVGPPWSDGWSNNGGWAPCSNLLGSGGSNNWIGPSENTATGLLNLHAITWVENNGTCPDDSASKNFYFGLHSLGSYEATASATYVFAYEFFVTEHQALYCGGFSNDNPGVFAVTETFFAIWDQTTQTNVVGNTYDQAPGLTYEDPGNCYNEETPWSGTNNVCDEEIQVSTAVSLQADNYYQPRVGVYAQTFADAYGSSEQYSIEDLYNYNSYCGAYDGVTLVSMSFNLPPGDAVTPQPPPVVLVADQNSTSSA